MRNEQKSAVQIYIEGLMAPASTAENRAHELAQGVGLDHISLSGMESQILKLMISIKQPQKLVEIGTLTGKTAVKMATIMSSGSQLWTLEKSPEHAQMAREVFASLPQNLQTRIHLVEGDARMTLEDIVKHGPFDLVFIDGNKSAYLEYARWCVQNMTSGGLVVADNVFLGGKVFQLLDSNAQPDKQTQIMDQFNRFFLQTSNWDAAILPTGEGLLIAQKR